MNTCSNGITSNTDRCCGDNQTCKRTITQKVRYMERPAEDACAEIRKRGRSNQAKETVKVRARRGRAFQAEGIAHAVALWQGEASCVYLAYRE